MNRVLTFIALSVLLFSCGGGGSDEGSTNNAPTKPSLMEPTDNLLCIDNNLTFSWGGATDQDGDTIKYVLEIAEDNQFTKIAHRFDDLSTSAKAVLLEKGKAFYWRVKAKDTQSESVYSDVFQLYTEDLGEVNHLPFFPTLVSPEVNADIPNTTVELEWGASDVDADDVLTYDVYLGTNSVPSIPLVTGHTSKNYRVPSLTSGTTYYWKVVVRDDKGGAAIGQIWSFNVD